MKRAVIYARYSSNNQTEQSIEGQVRVCKEYAEVKGLEIIGEYVDRAISGRTDNRPDFQRMISDCNKKIFDAVIVYRTDRFARDKYDSAVYKRVLKKAGIELHYAAEPIPEGPEGIILESLMEGLAEYYSAELSQKVKRGVRESALKCNFAGGLIPLGFTVSKDRKFIIEETGAKAVQIIFDMYIRGNTLTEISEHLNNNGFTNSKGEKFKSSSITSIIKNDKYIGVYQHGDVRREDAIPAIISKEKFALAQLELQRRRTSKQTNLPQIEYLLSGKLFCGECKKVMVGVSGTGGNKRRYHYYYCPDMRAKKGCQKTSIPKDKLEDIVISETVKHILNPETIKYIAVKLSEIQNKADTYEKEVKYYKKRLEENKQAQTNLLKAIENGVDLPNISSCIKELERDKILFTAELNKLSDKKIPITLEMLETFFLQYISLDSDEYKRKMKVLSLVSAVYLYDDKVIIYYAINPREENLSKSEYIFRGSLFDENKLPLMFKSEKRYPFKIVLDKCSDEEVDKFFEEAGIKLKEYC
jgi:DNA invertase Pin-like site-specific DNA recombinase